MRMFGVLRTLLGETEEAVVHECRTCGTTVDADTSACPRCGSTAIVSFETD